MDFKTHVLKAQYGGHLAHVPNLQYVGRQVANVDDVDPDLMSIFELRDAFKEVGIPYETSMYYRVGNLDLQVGLRLLNSD